MPRLLGPIGCAYTAYDLIKKEEKRKRKKESKKNGEEQKIKLWKKIRRRKKWLFIKDNHQQKTQHENMFDTSNLLRIGWRGGGASKHGKSTLNPRKNNQKKSYFSWCF